MSQKAAKETLIVIGAGPKGLAIAAKAAALRSVGLPAPNVIILEKSDIAAHWRGSFGYTNGNQLLGTPPEKDVGFPYHSTDWKTRNSAVNAKMMDFSWQQFLVDGYWYGFSDWVDRGRPPPTHSIWAEYLSWVSRKSKAQLKICEVKKIGIRNERFVLSCSVTQKQRSTTPISGDGLVITGPGEPLGLGEPTPHPRIFNGVDFWRHTRKFETLPSARKIALIGGGETAASIVVALVEIAENEPIVEVINPHGAIFSRGESYRENRLFSNPAAWRDSLSLIDRKNFISRTDAGVFSQMAMERLSRATNIEVRSGQVVEIIPYHSKVWLRIKYGKRITIADYDFVINAIGFDRLWFRKIMTPSVKSLISRATKNWNKDFISKSIDYDLSILRLRPRLHLPIIAGLQQGPGFPNLSCLGLVSDRILYPYVEEDMRKNPQQA